MIDLKGHCPIDVLADRLADTVAAWFKKHPEVTMVARDRSDTYASGIRQGAPAAVQVADRFHLFQNLEEILEEVFSAHHQDLEALNDMQSHELIEREDGSQAVPVPPAPQPLSAKAKAEQRRARRLARYEQVWDLHRQGWSVAAIVKGIGLSQGTVYNYLRKPTFSEYKKPNRRRRSVLSPYTDYILERWNSGCLDTRRLFEDVQRQGYPGSYATVARYTQRLAQAQGLRPRQRRPRGLLPQVAKPKTKLLTARGAAWLVLRREDKREQEEKEQLDQLQKQHQELAEAIDLAQDFMQMTRQRQGERLSVWLERAAASCLRPFQRFAKSLWEDYEAVKAGLTLRWSTGPVESQINRLKMIKRQMFGRANIDLLKLRVIYRM